MNPNTTWHAPDPDRFGRPRCGVGKKAGHGVVPDPTKATCRACLNLVRRDAERAAAPPPPTPSSWRHAVTRVVVRGEEQFAIREVFLGPAGEFLTVTRDAVAPVGDTIDELRATLTWMLAALDRPVLDMSTDAPVFVDPPHIESETGYLDEVSSLVEDLRAAADEGAYDTADLCRRAARALQESLRPEFAIGTGKDRQVLEWEVAELRRIANRLRDVVAGKDLALEQALDLIDSLSQPDGGVER